MKSLKTFLSETNTNRDLIVVDIQPIYSRGFTQHFLKTFADYINDGEFNSIFYLYNGPDLGGEEWWQLADWLMDHGVEEEKIESMESYDKGYAFFRSYMDMGMDENDLIAMIKYMFENKIYDSRDLPDEVWEDLGLDRDDWEPDMINIPDVFFKLQHYNNPLLCGGEKMNV